MDIGLKQIIKNPLAVCNEMFHEKVNKNISLSLILEYEVNCLSIKYKSGNTCINWINEYKVNLVSHISDLLNLFWSLVKYTLIFKLSWICFTGLEVTAIYLRLIIT